jgi:hypothetical protein
MVQKTRGDEEVKYIGYWEFDLNYANEVCAEYMKMEEKRAKEPEK